MVDKVKKYWCICGSQKPITYVKQDYTFKALKQGVVHNVTIKDFEMPTCQDCGANYFTGKEDEQMTKAVEDLKS